MSGPVARSLNEASLTGPSMDRLKRATWNDINVFSPAYWPRIMSGSCSLLSTRAVDLAPGAVSSVQDQSDLQVVNDQGTLSASQFSLLHSVRAQGPSCIHDHRLDCGCLVAGSRIHSDGLLQRVWALSAGHSPCGYQVLPHWRTPLRAFRRICLGKAVRRQTFHKGRVEILTENPGVVR